VGVAQIHAYFPKKNKVNIACGTTYSFSPYSLSSRPEAAGIYKLHARLPICPPACPKPALLCYKKTEQNECDCIIFVTLCSSNCLYTKKSNKYQKTDYNYVVIFRWV